MSENLPIVPDATDLLGGVLTWPEATVMIIKRDRRILENSAVRDFLHAMRRFNSGPWEALNHYYKHPATSESRRHEIIQGCLDYFEECKIQIGKNERIFEQDPLNPVSLSRTHYAWRDFITLVSFIGRVTPKIIDETIGSEVRRVYDECRKVNYPYERDLQELVVSTDLRPWTEKRGYWIDMLSSDHLNGHAFGEVCENEPHNLLLDTAVTDIMIAKLTGRTDLEALHLLADLWEKRDYDDAVLCKVFDAVPDELSSALGGELERRKFSRGWIRFVPLRGEYRRDAPAENFIP